MGIWRVSENPSGDGYREFEMTYQEHYESLTRRFVRIHDDGRIEIGVCHSPFTARWGEQVLQDQTNLIRNLRVMQTILKDL